MSVRRTIVLVVLLIVVMPFVLLGAALAWERWLVAQETTQLSKLADELRASPRESWAAKLESRLVWVRVFDAEGVSFDSHSKARAQLESPLGNAFHALLPSTRTVLALDAPALARAPQAPTDLEIEEGRGVVVRVPLALESGETLVLDAVLLRGIRQLVLVRVELAKLIFLQSLIALAAGLILARRIVRPLETLSAGARRFPLRALANRELLERRDEVGDVARALDELVRSLDARWRESVSLAGDLTHEYKNPLATIAAASERLAQSQNLTAEKRAEWTALIAQAVERLQRSTDALLDEVKTAARVHEAEPREIQYPSFLEQIIERYRSDPQWSEWRFELIMDAEVRTITVDAESWKSAICNLIDNALVQPTKDKRVRLEVRREASTIHTEVTDFGPGVSEGNREKIFQRFFTQRPEGTPRGTGLGLAIVQAVAGAHQGSVTLQPHDPARGACFRLSVPAPAATP